MRDDDRAVRVEDDGVALTDRRASDFHGVADGAGSLLLRAAHPDVAGPDRQAELAQLIHVANRGVHQQGGDAPPESLRREQLAHERDGLGLGHRQHEDLPRLRLGHGGVHHQVVSLAAADRASGPGCL